MPDQPQEPEDSAAAAPAEEAAPVAEPAAAAPSDPPVAQQLPKDVHLPSSVTLVAPFAYYDEEGQLHAWSAGLVVTDPVDIEDLLLREARLEV